MSWFTFINVVCTLPDSSSYHKLQNYCIKQFCSNLFVYSQHIKQTHANLKMHKNCNMFHTYTHNKYCSGDNLWTIPEDKLPISTFSTFCNTGHSISGCTSQLWFYSSAYYPVSSLSSQAFHLDAFQASTVLVVLSLTIFFASPINHTTPIRSTVMS